MPIPRYRPQGGPALFSAGFRPFFLAAASWAALAIPLWLFVFAGTIELPGTLALLLTGPLTAGRGTTAIYALVTLAALLRLLAPLAASHYLVLLALAGAAWSGGFGLFVLLYAPALARPRQR